MKSRYLIYLTGFLCITLNGAAVAENALPPKKLTLSYQAIKDGKPIATVNEKLTHDGTNYRIESTAKAKGIYALLGERKLISIGTINPVGLRPTHFESHLGGNTKKSLVADFDWKNLTLSMTRKGKTTTAGLNAGAQDLLSFGYQFMFVNFASLKPKQYSVYLTTGKKYKAYKFSVEYPKKSITTQAGQFKTIHLSEVTGSNTPPSKEIWLGAKNIGSKIYQLPIKLIIRDKSSTIEQVLTSINAE